MTNETTDTDHYEILVAYGTRDDPSYGTRSGTWLRSFRANKFASIAEAEDAIFTTRAEAAARMDQLRAIDPEWPGPIHAIRRIGAENSDIIAMYPPEREAATADFDAATDPADASYTAVMAAAYGAAAPDAGIAAYDAVMERARAEYNAAIESARAAYHAAMETPRAEYDAAIEPAIAARDAARELALRGE